MTKVNEQLSEPTSCTDRLGPLLLPNLHNSMWLRPFPMKTVPPPWNLSKCIILSSFRIEWVNGRYTVFFECGLCASFGETLSLKFQSSHLIEDDKCPTRRNAKPLVFIFCYDQSKAPPLNLSDLHDPAQSHSTFNAALQKKTRCVNSA